TSGRVAWACGARTWHSWRITCGFTASTHSAVPCTALLASAKTCTPKSVASAWRSGSTGSATRMAVVSAPRAARPPIRLRAMLPPPRKAMEASGVGDRESEDAGMVGRWAGTGVDGIADAVALALRGPAPRRSRHFRCHVLGGGRADLRMARGGRARRQGTRPGQPRKARKRPGLAAAAGALYCGEGVVPHQCAHRGASTRGTNTDGYRRTAGVLGQEQGVRPAPVRRAAADDPRRRRRAPDQHPGAGPQAGARAGVRHHVGQAAPRLRGILRGRLLL